MSFSPCVDPETCQGYLKNIFNKKNCEEFVWTPFYKNNLTFTYFRFKKKLVSYVSFKEKYVAYVAGQYAYYMN